MKLRIQGNSLRLRISRPDLEQLMKLGHIEETIQFVPSPDARLTYALAVGDVEHDAVLEYHNRTVTIVLSRAAARRWAESDEVGVYGDGPVALAVEKDFACLERNGPQDADAFPNPRAGAVC